MCWSVCVSCVYFVFFFFFSSRRRHTRCSRDWSSDVCSSDLLIQVAGRAGRGRSPGRVLVQAFKPDAVSLDYEAFAAAELRRREALRFPPFVRLAAVRLAGNYQTRVRGDAERTASVARRLARDA